MSPTRTLSALLILVLPAACANVQENGPAKGITSGIGTALMCHVVVPLVAFVGGPGGIALWTALTDRHNQPAAWCDEHCSNIVPRSMNREKGRLVPPGAPAECRA